MKEISKGNLKVPESVAIIMDGNGRWAKARGLARSAGHARGVRNIKRVVSALHSLGVRYVTLYAFSTENWKRPADEVNGIMDLAYEYISARLIPELKQGADLCVRFLGDKSALPERLRQKCTEAESLGNPDGFVLNIALNYGGRAELVNAVNAAIKDGHTEFTEQIISKYLYTAHSKDPDLIIRTGGEFRISNFLLWQSAYSEYYITDTLWPDLGREELAAAMAAFGSRSRRYGGLDPKEQNERK